MIRSSICRDVDNFTAHPTVHNAGQNSVPTTTFVNLPTKAGKVDGVPHRAELRDENGNPRRERHRTS